MSTWSCFDCLLEDGVLARDARLASVGLAGCLLGQRNGPPLDAEHLTCSLLNLTRARIISHSRRGAVRLLGTRIGGGLDRSGAELRNDSGPALSADRLQVDQSPVPRQQVHRHRRRYGCGGQPKRCASGWDAGLRSSSPGTCGRSSLAARGERADLRRCAPADLGPGLAGPAAAWHPRLCGPAVSAAGRRIPGAGPRTAGPRDLDGTTRRRAG